MKALVELYVQQFKTTIVMMLQYRAMLAIYMIGHVLEPLVYLIVWSTVARTGDGSVGGYTEQGFAAYFILMMLVNHITDLPSVDTVKVGIID
jgi:ABC-2 type transport system permease protein